MPQCPHCQAVYEEGQRYCPACGSLLRQPEEGDNSCPQGGARLSPRQEFCQECNAPLRRETPRAGKGSAEAPQNESPPRALPGVFAKRCARLGQRNRGHGHYHSHSPFPGRTAHQAKRPASGAFGSDFPGPGGSIPQRPGGGPEGGAAANPFDGAGRSDKEEHYGIHECLFQHLSGL
jgi:Double zinc ribbon